MPKARNIIIFFLIIAMVAGGAYALWKPDAAPEVNLITTPGASLPDVGGSGAALPQGDTALVADNFLSLLLNVQNIRLEDTVLSDPAFKSLHDSSIELTHDGNEGRPNPFARLGSDPAAPAGAATSLPETEDETAPITENEALAPEEAEDSPDNLENTPGETL